MPRGKTIIANMPPYAQDTADRLAFLGFSGFTFWDGEPLGDDAKTIQIRDIDTGAPPRKVAHYTELIKQGAKFPPIIYTGDGYTLDGNTRRLAARKAGRTTFPAIILAEHWEGAPPALEEKFIIAGAAFNLKHGENISVANRERVILKAAQNNPDISVDDLARQLGVARNTVSSTLNADKARAKAADLGIDPDTCTMFTKSHWAELGSARVRAMDSDEFRDLVLLVRDHALSTNGQRHVIDQLIKLPTHAERLNLIKGEAASRVKIRQGAATRPEPAAMLRQHLGYLLKYWNNGNVGRLVETGDEDAVKEHNRVIWDALTALRKLENEQRDMDEKRFGNGATVTASTPRFSG